MLVQPKCALQNVGLVIFEVGFTRGQGWGDFGHEPVQVLFDFRQFIFAEHAAGDDESVAVKLCGELFRILTSHSLYSILLYDLFPAKP